MSAACGRRSGIARTVRRFGVTSSPVVAVAARRALHEDALAVGKADRQAVELGLDRVFDRRRRPAPRARACRRRALPPRRTRCRATASACGAAPRRIPAAARRRRAGSANRRDAVPGAPPPARRSSRNSRSYSASGSPDRPARSSGGCGARFPAAAARPGRRPASEPPSPQENRRSAAGLPGAMPCASRRARTASSCCAIAATRALVQRVAVVVHDACRPAPRRAGARGAPWIRTSGACPGVRATSSASVSAAGAALAHRRRRKRRAVARTQRVEQQLLVVAQREPAVVLERAGRPPPPRRGSWCRRTGRPARARRPGCPLRRRTRPARAPPRPRPASPAPTPPRRRTRPASRPRSGIRSGRPRRWRRRATRAAGRRATTCRPRHRPSSARRACRRSMAGHCSRTLACAAGCSAAEFDDVVDGRIRARAPSLRRGGAGLGALPPGAGFAASPRRRARRVEQHIGMARAETRAPPRAWRRAPGCGCRRARRPPPARRSTSSPI